MKAADGDRLTDRIGVGVLTATFPPALVDEVLAVAGRASQRQRPLPARVVVSFTLAMCLWADEEDVEVARLLVGGLQTMARWRGSWRVPTSGAITRARARLGSPALKTLLERVAAPDQHRGRIRLVVAGPAPRGDRRNGARPSGCAGRRGALRAAGVWAR